MNAPLPTFRSLVSEAARLFLIVSPVDGNALRLRDLAPTAIPDADLFAVVSSATTAIVAVVNVLGEVNSNRLPAAIVARKAMHRATMAYFGIDVDAPAEHDVCPVAITA